MTVFLEGIRRLFSSKRTATTISEPQSSPKGKGQSCNFEVERKFFISANELNKVKERLCELGFQSQRKITMHDYFLPVKIPGEMLRVRDEQIAGHHESVFTIKEWVQIGTGKERKELEGHLPAFQRSILLSLGKAIQCGLPLSCFAKERNEYTNTNQEGVTVALDVVQGLGENSGNYAEIEVLVPQDGNVDEARAVIIALAYRLFNEEREPVKMSYQQMLEAFNRQTRV
jgi:adenylate cyclase class IV